MVVDRREMILSSDLREDDLQIETAGGRDGEVFSEPLIGGGDSVMHKHRPILFPMALSVMLILLIPLTGCKKAEASEQEAVRVFSRLIRENELFYSEDGGIWWLTHRERKREGDPERVTAQRLGPVFLPESEDIGKTLSLKITGIRKYEHPENPKRPDWWYLDYTFEQTAKATSHPSLSLQIRLDGQWYLFPLSSLPNEPGSINLMKGKFYPEQTEQLVPGHYRLVLRLRDHKGMFSFDVLEFDLTETEEGYAIDGIQTPTDLYPEKAQIPEKNIRCEDGSRWRLTEAGELYLWDYVMTDTLEAETQDF